MSNLQIITLTIGIIAYLTGFFGFLIIKPKEFNKYERIIISLLYLFSLICLILFFY